jgi:osmotically-inducible protein OsmY
MMKKSRSTIPTIAAALAVFLSVGCRPNQTLETQTKDAGMEAAIKTRLAAEVGAATVTAVEVNVTNGAVTLAGPVGSAEERQRIEDVARSVEGVVSVMNNLQIVSTQVVSPPPPPAATMTP